MSNSDSERPDGSVPAERIVGSILILRGQRVLLDADLAALYGVETKTLVRAVQRNKARFPPDFMFQLSREEFENLRYQFGTSSSWGGRRHHPYAFTEHGVAMLSSVLRSKRAVQVNIEIVRAFVRLREMLRPNAELAQKIAVEGDLVETVLNLACGPRRLAPLDRIDLHQENIVRPGIVEEREERRIAHIAAVPIGHAVDLDGTERGRQAGRGHEVVGGEFLAAKHLDLAGPDIRRRNED